MNRSLACLILPLLAAASFLSCSSGSKTTGTHHGLTGPANVSLVVTSVRATPHRLQFLDSATPPSFTLPTQFGAGSINSGAPDYLKLTIRRIEIEGDWGGWDTLWAGSKELNITGSTVDVSDMNADFRPIHTGTATTIRTYFDSDAKVLGSLTGAFVLNASPWTLDTLTVYTKAAYGYNAETHTGGADSCLAFETGPTEETDLWIGADTDQFSIETPCSEAITDSTMSHLTILIDLNRVLRFYAGTFPSGPNPTDSANTSYFFGHTTFGSFIAPFFGTPGTIEGYRTFFSADHAGGLNGEGVYGWMTLIFDSHGTYLSGMMIGDDDNALTVAKGRVSSFGAQGGGNYTFSYDTANGTVTDFERVATVGNYSTMATFACSNLQDHAGQAYFQLLLKQ